MTEPAWLTKARTYIGFHEQPGNRGIEEFIALAHAGALGDPWCAIFANGMLEATGFPGTRSPAARSFEDNEHFVELADPVPGAITTMWRGSPSSGSGHVGFYVGEDSRGELLLAGNQSDQVNIEPQPRKRITGHWWPASAPLPGMASQPSPDFSQSGKGSWYSQFSGCHEWVDRGDKPNSNALGVPDSAQGVSFYNRDTLGKWFDVRAPNGVISIEQQTDIGPAPHTGRTIDISAAAAERFGYAPDDFPTDSMFAWRPDDPPAAVAGLTPREQAVKYRDLRKEHPMPDTDKGGPITVIPHDDDFFMRMVQYFIAHPDAIQRVTAFAAYVKSGKEPEPAPKPATRPTPPAQPSKLGFGTGILGMIAAALGWQQGVIAAPVGEGASLASVLSFALPLALSVFGAGGGLAGILGKVGGALLKGMGGIKSQ